MSVARLSGLDWNNITTDRQSVRPTLKTLRQSFCSTLHRPEAVQCEYSFICISSQSISHLLSLQCSHPQWSIQSFRFDCFHHISHPMLNYNSLPSEVPSWTQYNTSAVRKVSIRACPSNECILRWKSNQQGSGLQTTVDPWSWLLVL